MGLLTPGYWPATYWARNYWHDGYWQDYGVVEVQAVFSTIASRAFLSPQIGGKMFIAVDITAKAHNMTTLSAKEEQ